MNFFRDEPDDDALEDLNSSDEHNKQLLKNDDKDVNKRYMKDLYDYKKWWSFVVSLFLILCCLVIIGSAAYLIYEDYIVSSSCTGTTGSTGTGETLTGASLLASLIIPPNYTSTPIFRIYNQATNYISNEEISNGMIYPLKHQIEVDIKYFWGATGTIVFNASANQYKVLQDGSWPVFFINQNLDEGLAYHSISQEPFNPSFAGDVLTDTPFAVIEFAAICPDGTTHLQCLASVSVAVSHELMEAIMDKNVDQMIVWQTITVQSNPLTDEIHAYHEIADPVQEQTYIYGNYSNFPIQNFVTPAWFDQLSNNVNPNEVLYDFMGLINQPGGVSNAGYIAYVNMTDSCYYYYLPSQTVYGQHDRVVQSSSYRRGCKLSTGTIVGSDSMGFSFANVYGSDNEELLSKAVAEARKY